MTPHEIRRLKLLRGARFSRRRDFLATVVGLWSTEGSTPYPSAYALRQYLDCRRALVSELGVEPATRTSRLRARILAGEAV